MAWNVFMHPLSNSVIGLEDDRATPAGQYGFRHEEFALRFDLVPSDPRRALTAVWFSRIELDDPEASLSAVIGADLATRFAEVALSLETEPVPDGDYAPELRIAAKPLIAGDEAEVPFDIEILDEALGGRASDEREARLRRPPLWDGAALRGWVIQTPGTDSPGALLGTRPFALPPDGASVQSLWWRGIADRVLEAVDPPSFIVERDGGTVRVALDRVPPDVERGMVARLIKEGDDPGEADDTDEGQVVGQAAFDEGVAELSGVPDGGLVRAEIVDHAFRPVVDRRSFVGDMARQAGVVAVAATEAGADAAAARWWWEAAELLYDDVGMGTAAALADAYAAGGSAGSG